MDKERIVINVAAKEYSTLWDERTIWEEYVFHKKHFIPGHWAYLDSETSKKIRNLQRDTDFIIRNLIKENLGKKVIITEDDMKNYKVK